ncbi:unnamed protein product [Toxocara canis]|uniref:Phage protein n=1 Tax=Toxocara canis TaxID=6265 RepID=A0A183V801_TOXCA|nr:unnamed protein product [Toxocara canis]
MASVSKEVHVEDLERVAGQGRFLCIVIGEYDKYCLDQPVQPIEMDEHLVKVSDIYEEKAKVAMICYYCEELL